ncbi:hypothetical protein VNO80_23123 [Phaseolus coccineus]|uniref:Uncharacterized protein n=1 Tax=Phaseolus coccineus TaxID=3886 RepID=A0AAN9M5D2_PHACN
MKQTEFPPATGKDVELKGAGVHWGNKKGFFCATEGRISHCYLLNVSHFLYQKENLAKPFNRDQKKSWIERQWMWKGFINVPN